MRDKQALTTGEVAKYCGVNFRTVIRWIERGHLEAYKLPGRGDNRIPVQGFIDFLKNNNMPVPDELLMGGRTLLLLSDESPVVSDLATAVRRCGWELLLTSDPIYFGYLVSHRQPAAIAVMTDEGKTSVERLLREGDGRDVLCIHLITAPNISSAAREGWLNFDWPTDQQALIACLTNDVAA